MKREDNKQKQTKQNILTATLLPGVRISTTSSAEQTYFSTSKSSVKAPELSETSISTNLVVASLLHNA